MNKFLKAIGLGVILWTSSANSAEKLSGTNVQAVGSWAFDVLDNDTLFSVKNTKLEKSYGFQFGVFNMNDSNSEIGIEVGYRLHNEKSKAAFALMPGANYESISMENKMLTLMLKGNHYLAIDKGSMSPYIGGGIGAARTNFSFNGTLNGKDFLKADEVIKKIKLAYSAEAGIVSTLSQSLMIGVGIEYFRIIDVKKDDFEDAEMGVNTIREGKIKTGEFSTKVFLKVFI